MKIAELRNHPFLLLVLKEGQEEGIFTAEFMHKTQQQLTDMSLRIASDNLSIIYADQIRKGCEIVLGMCNLGLLDLCDGSTDKAKEIITTEGIVYCFRAGWGKYAQIKKISPSFFEEISLTQYAQSINDASNIKAMHEDILKTCYQSAKLLETYKIIASNYSANTILEDDDEDILKFELQKFINSAVALLLISAEKKVFTTTSYQQLLTYLTNTDKNEILDNIVNCIETFKRQLPVVTRSYLQDIDFLAFAELKDIINHHPDDISIYLQEIVELPITVVNELNNDFDGGYDFHLDDEDDIAYLRPDNNF